MGNILQKKDRQNIVKAAHYYISEIKRKLTIQHWTEFNVNEETVVLVSPEISYSFDGINLTLKHLSNERWNCNLRGYFINNTGGYVYTFVMTPKK